jgi:hypothetical protein
MNCSFNIEIFRKTLSVENTVIQDIHDLCNSFSKTYLLRFEKQITIPQIGIKDFIRECYCHILKGYNVILFSD